MNQPPSEHRSGVNRILIIAFIISDIIVIGLLLYVFKFSENVTVVPQPPTTNETTDETDSVKMETKELAKEILTAIKNKDASAKIFETVSDIRFSPYSNVKKDDQVYGYKDLAALFQSTQPIHWGDYDGSGEPINLKFDDYAAKFIFNKDYLSSEEVTVGAPKSRGNMINNTATFYKDAQIVEFYMPGTNPESGGMDWGSVYVTLTRHGDAISVGIIHDQWTI